MYPNDHSYSRINNLMLIVSLKRTKKTNKLSFEFIA